MYVKAQVVFGYDITDEEDLVEILRGNEPEAFIAPYSGADPYYGLGVELDQFDECSTVRVSDLTLVPSKEQVAKLAEVMGQLSEEARAEFESANLGEPCVFFLWGTS